MGEISEEMAADLLRDGHQVLWCPNTGDIIFTGHDDDKVICDCGKANPQVLEVCKEEEIRNHIHYVRYLVPYTA